MTASSQNRAYPPVSFIVLAFFVYYFPVLLIYFGVIPFDYRFHILIAIALVLAFYSWSQGISLRELGFRTDNLKNAMVANIALSLVLGALTFAAYSKGLIRDPSTPNLMMFGIFYVLVSCPAQEFSCRGFLFAEMNRRGISGLATQVAISSVSYAFLHIIYRDWITFLVTLFIGAIWGVIYWKYPNLWGVIFSHAVIGLISLAVGLV